jgi:tRNA pseudouridine55 synthase
MTRRSRRAEEPGPSGFLIADKPPGLTSHDVVNAARRWFGTRRVGHLGTLDPRATGVLPLAVRDATKLAPYVASDPKIYVGSIRLGVATDTYDAEGEVVRRHEGELPSEEKVRAALADFVGEIDQVPPMYSSVKHGGEPLHRLARRGETVERAPRRVRIDRIDVHAFRPPDVEIQVECSGGTYVRCLAEDLGVALSCGAHLLHLRRTRSGPFGLDGAVQMEEMAAAAERGEAESHLIPAQDGLAMPRVELPAADARRVQHGGDVPCPPVAGPPPRPGRRVAAIDPAGRLLAIMDVRPDRRLHPVRVLAVVDPQG